MATAEKLLTAEDFFLLPKPLEGGKMELVRGRVVVMCPVGFEHGEIAGRISDALNRFTQANRLGVIVIETGFRLSVNPDVVRTPDISFVREDRRPTGERRKRFFEGAPDLAVEIVSPGDLDAEVARKVIEYLAAGSTRVWVVRPDLELVTVECPDGSARTHGAGEVLTSSDAGFDAPGFELPIGPLYK